MDTKISQMKDRGEFYSNSIETLNDIIRQKDLELDFLREEVRRLKSGATVITRKINETREWLLENS